jgi:hypothetical protein
MLSQNLIKINSTLRTYILKSINNSIDKKVKLLFENEIKKKENNLYYNNDIVSNDNISGFIFFLSLSIIHLIFSNKK